MFKIDVDYYIDEDTDDFTLTKLHERFAKRAIGVECGRNRNVFLFKKYVVKIPKNSLGYMDNEWEGSISNNDQDNDLEYYVQYPRTRLYKDNILFMERISHATDDEIISVLGAIPDWTYSVDCGQVGFTKKMRLVAYDYGYY